MSSRERRIVIAVALVCAATRFLAVARSLWEWDEALLVLGMRDYDVTVHHPHPPGFPVYIALGKLLRLVLASDFRALQAINIAAAMLVFPAVYFFARQLGFRFSIAVMAGALFAFFPNVWFFGGTAFSDIPSVVLVLFAVTYLLRGAESRNAYWLGTLLLALAIGIRPQNILVGLIPGIYATLKRRPHEVAIAFLIGLLVVGAAFGGAIYATGSYERFAGAIRGHSEYIANVDSWRNPERPPMWRLLDRFFVKQYQSPLLGIIATIFVIVSAVGSWRERSRPMLFNVLAFLPFALFAWAMLDRHSVNRFSIAYQPMFALLVADGLQRTGRRYAPILAAALVTGFAVYTIPALTPVRNEVAPSIQAARAVPQMVDPRRARLYVGHTMSKFVDLVSPRFPYTRIVDDRVMPLSTTRPAWVLAELTKGGEGGFVFRRERGNLWNIARRHYFGIKLQPLEQQARFVSGWYPAETTYIYEWRWMGARSVTLLPPGGEQTLLRIHLSPAGELANQSPTITIRLNGVVLDQLRISGDFDRDYRVKAAPNGMPNVLELTTDKTVTPSQDTRVLGLKLRELGWGPA
jgi:hypothetical protein